jgi:hypothetical protein
VRPKRADTGDKIDGRALHGTKQYKEDSRHAIHHAAEEHKLHTAVATALSTEERRSVDE